jgi:hypothetical protein
LKLKTLPAILVLKRVDKYRHMATENISTIINSFHTDLKVAKEFVYDKCGFDLTNPKLNSESLEYGACSFELNGNTIQHRVSKITPTKTGQFVTLWKRNKNGITEPFDILDDNRFYTYYDKRWQQPWTIYFSKICSG